MLLIASTCRAGTQHSLALPLRLRPRSRSHGIHRGHGRHAAKLQVARHCLLQV